MRASALFAVAMVASLSACAADSERMALPKSSPVAATASAAPKPAWRSIGDVDGDGRPDVAHIVDLHKPNGDDMGFAAYQLSVRMTSLGVQTIQIGGDREDPETPAGLQNRILGGSDIDGDGRREIFVKVDQGASTWFAEVFRIWRGRLQAVTLNGRPTFLGAAGSLADIEWFNCADRPLLTVGDAQHTTSVKSYTETVDRYRLVATALVRATHETRVVTCPGKESEPGCPGLTWD